MSADARWDLEEIPYETNDPAGGWYLHFDPTGENSDAALYMSKAHVTPAQANTIAAAPEALAAAKAAIDWWHHNGRNFTRREPAWLVACRAAVARSEGRQA